MRAEQQGGPLALKRQTSPKPVLAAGKRVAYLMAPNGRSRQVCISGRRQKRQVDTASAAMRSAFCVQEHKQHHDVVRAPDELSS
jgi:hypothetical protein